MHCVLLLGSCPLAARALINVGLPQILSSKVTLTIQRPELEPQTMPNGRFVSIPWMLSQINQPRAGVAERWQDLRASVASPVTGEQPCSTALPAAVSPFSLAPLPSMHLEPVL